jgi:hypothetical protein
MSRRRGHLLSQRRIEETGAFIAAQQRPSGEIPWFSGGKMDPWDHVHAAMGLISIGRLDAARAAFRYLADTQEETGGWVAERCGDRVVDRAHETNHAAYIATGLWYYHRATGDTDFLAELWPTVQRAIDFVVRLQDETGAISWAIKNGRVWEAPLLTGSASIHGSLVCAERMAERLDYDRPAWRGARCRLAHVLRTNPERFSRTDLPEKTERYSMDWYYPVLGGAVRGLEAWRQLFDPVQTRRFITEGVGCRCVADRPWYTIAETCELVVAYDAIGLGLRGRQILSWVGPMRTEGGGYWTGRTHPEGELYPKGEQTAWTAATVLIADDVLAGDSATSAFFRDLGEGQSDRRALRLLRAPREIREPAA